MNAEKSTFVYVIYIRVTPEKLWQALTDPETSPKYFVGTRFESEWTKGALWRLLIPDGRVADAGEVLEVEPGKRLALSWRNEFMPEVREEGFSRMTCELEPEGTSTKLTLTHEMNRPGSRLIAGVSSGWPHILSSLKSLLETGESLAETREWPEGM